MIPTMELDSVDILLVDDRDAQAELTLRALRRSNLISRVHRVANGAAAIELLCGPAAAALPRVVLLDLEGPGSDGLEVLRRIKTDPRTRAIPVVVLTSSTEDRDRAAAYVLGANSYIVIRSDSDDFIETIEQLGVYWSLLNVAPGR